MAGAASGSDSRRPVFIVIAVVAVLIAIYSITRTISSQQGRNMGSLGDMGGGKKAAAAGGGVATSGGRKVDPLSGAPVDAENGGVSSPGRSDK